MEPKIRIVVVDDSAFMRSAIKGMIQTDPSMEVVATARDGEEAIEKIKQFKPDIVTMDVEMPRMNGLTAVKTLMQEYPVPVLMVSSLTEEGAQVTFEAMDAGAVDFISKDLGNRSMNVLNIQEDLINRIKAIISQDHKFKKVIKPASASTPISKIQTGTMSGNVLCVALGVSTGGPKALQSVIPFIPKDFSVPIVIVQHMPEAFTKCFSERLNANSEIYVKEAEHGDVLKPGMCVVAKGGRHLRLFRSRLEVVVELSEHPKDSLYRPSVNEMMLSASKAFGGRVLGVIMTGMGNDGLIGMHSIKEAGGKTMVQDESTCIVYGMPKAVVDDGIADKIVPLEKIAPEIVNMV